jgi:hypothetical protein
MVRGERGNYIYRVRDNGGGRHQVLGGSEWLGRRGCLPSQVAAPERPELFGEVQANSAVQGEGWGCSMPRYPAFPLVEIRQSEATCGLAVHT